MARCATSLCASEGTAQRVRTEPDDIRQILGARKFDNEVAIRTCIPGVATGLAWTPVGGDVLFVEGTRTTAAASRSSPASWAT